MGHKRARAHATRAALGVRRVGREGEGGWRGAEPSKERDGADGSAACKVSRATGWQSVQGGSTRHLAIGQGGQAAREQLGTPAPSACSGVAAIITCEHGRRPPQRLHEWGACSHAIQCLPKREWRRECWHLPRRVQRRHRKLGQWHRCFPDVHRRPWRGKGFQNRHERHEAVFGVRLMGAISGGDQR